MTNFKLDSKLENDSFYIADLALSQLRLINNSNFIWLILVPRKADLIEIIDLNGEEYIQFFHEVNIISKLVKDMFQADKLNIASIGNIVPQLHMHIVARFKNDLLYPKPVWGVEFNKYPKIPLDFIEKINAYLQ